MGEKQYLIGIDEVGRGSLAGPVMVGAVGLEKGWSLKIKEFEKASGILLKDSKQLTEKEREIWCMYIKQNFSYAVSSVAPRIIDRINILEASIRGATRAVKKLLTKRNTDENISIILDGSLYMEKQKRKKGSQDMYMHSKNGKVKVNAETRIRADESEPAVSLASIIAKVTRDRYMKRLHKKYPEYDLNQNKGYGTKRHRKAIREYGPKLIHRLTFLKKLSNMK